MPPRRVKVNKDINTDTNKDDNSDKTTNKQTEPQNTVNIVLEPVQEFKHDYITEYNKSNDKNDIIDKIKTIKELDEFEKEIKEHKVKYDIFYDNLKKSKNDFDLRYAQFFNTFAIIRNHYDKVNELRNKFSSAISYSEYTSRRYDDLDKKIKDKRSAIVKLAENKPAGSIRELINIISNPHQQDVLYRIISDHENFKVYLQNFEPNTDKKKKTLKGTIHILGNYNRSKGVRESYEVKVFENDPKGSFWCSCADHKFNSAKKNIVCKHISFIVCKVLKIMEPYFFETKTLTPAHLAKLLDKFADNSEIWKDIQYVRKSDFITILDFKVFPDPLNDICTFCYDEVTTKDKNICCSCPICKHGFHEECMGVWMENNSKCSFCSNDIWKYYKRIKAGEEKIKLTS